MQNEKNKESTAVILLAKGYDEGFVNRCVGDLREAGVRTYLIGLESQYITSWHGVAIQADAVLRHWKPTEKTKMVVVPGRPACVNALTFEPKVSELVRRVLTQDGWVAVANSAESTLNRQKENFPPDMRILPEEIAEGRCLTQGDVEDRAFIRSLIQHIA